MKYFKPELCWDMSDEANEVGNKTGLTIGKVLRSTRTGYPAWFVQAHCRHGFHDYQLDSLLFVKESEKPKYQVQMVLNDGISQYTVHYLGVVNFTLEGNLAEAGDYLYGEILPVDKRIPFSGNPFLGVPRLYGVQKTKVQP